MTSWVHRYTSRQLMDDGFDLFKERSLDLLIAGLIPGCLIAIYWVLVRTFVFPGNLLTEYTPEKIDELAALWPFWVYIVVLPSLVVLPVALSLALILQCRIAALHILGGDGSVRRAFGLLAKPFFSLFVVCLIFGAMHFVVGIVAAIINFLILAIFAGIGGIFIYASTMSGAMMVVGYVFIAIGYAIAITVNVVIYLGFYVLFLAAPVSLAYEHAGPFKALGQSFSIGMSNFKAHFLALLVFIHTPVILSVLLFTIGYAAYSLLRYQLPEYSIDIIPLFGLILMMAFTGLLSCLLALAYVDGRCRRDALDLQLLATDIGLGETFARLYRPGIRMPQAQYPNYTGEPRIGPSAVAPAPNYAAPPPTASGLPPASAYPDYSVPPPLLAGADSEPPAPAYPDYSAPPPLLEPADAPPAEPAGWAMPPDGAEADEKREGADVP